MRQGGHKSQEIPDSKGKKGGENYHTRLENLNRKETQKIRQFVNQEVNPIRKPDGVKVKNKS